MAEKDYTEETEVNVLSYPDGYDWAKVYSLATMTMGKETFPTRDNFNEPSAEWKHKILLSEHSPIRALEWVIQIKNIPYYTSVHFVRHKIGVEHFVKSQRNDRQNDYDRRNAPQSAPVNHTMLINAAALMQMSHMRLCGKADIDTRKVMRKIVFAVCAKNPEMQDFLVPRCRYIGRCPEFQSCGLVKEEK